MLDFCNPPTVVCYLFSNKYPFPITTTTTTSFSALGLAAPLILLPPSLHSSNIIEYLFSTSTVIAIDGIRMDKTHKIPIFMEQIIPATIHRADCLHSGSASIPVHCGSRSLSLTLTHGHSIVGHEDLHRHCLFNLVDHNGRQSPWEHYNGLLMSNLGVRYVVQVC